MLWYDFKTFTLSVFFSNFGKLKIEEMLVYSTYCDDFLYLSEITVGTIYLGRHRWLNLYLPLAGAAHQNRLDQNVWLTELLTGVDNKVYLGKIKQYKMYFLNFNLPELTVTQIQILMCTLCCEELSPCILN